MTKFNFQDGKGEVPAHQHPNGKGWVADTATAADSTYIGPDAWVSGNARVFGDAWVSGDARVSGDAWVLWGKTREFNWTAYACKQGVSLRFGCETHYLAEWDNLHDKLEAKHKVKNGASMTRAVVALIRATMA